jgi:Uma2 family endonuclease
MGLPARKMDRRYTYADYRTWPDDERWELIDGVAWNMSPAPNRRHQGLLGELYAQVVNGVKATACRLYLAPFDVLLPDSADQREDDVACVVQPDLTGICDASRLTPRGCFGAPDWVVEIISPWTMKKDLHEKFVLYERNGIREYWLIDPASRTLQVYRMGPAGRYGEAEILEENAEIACPLGDGIVVHLAELFAAG